MILPEIGEHRLQMMSCPCADNINRVRERERESEIKRQREGWWHIRILSLDFVAKIKDGDSYGRGEGNKNE